MTLQTPQNVTRRRGAEAAIVALAAGFTQSQAADVAHVHRATISRWLQAADFRRRVDEASAEGLREARRIITAAAADAARKLKEIATAPASTTVLPVHTRLRAVCALLDAAERGHEAGLVEQRLSAIEERLGLVKGVA